MTNIIRKSAFFALGLLVSCALAETSFRIVEATPLRFVLPASEIAMYGPDPDTGYRHRAGASGLWLTEQRTDITISRLGLRDRERTPERGGDLRVVVVGDSLLEAVQVALDNTAAVIAEKQVAAAHAGAEVVNLGLAGATPPVLAARLQVASRALNPDLAIVVLNIGDFFSSSLRDDSAFTGYRPSSDGSINLSYGFRDSRGYKIRTSGIGYALYWSLDHSALARVLNSRKNIGILAEWPTPPQSIAISPEKCVSAKAALRSYLRLWHDGEPKTAAGVLDAFIRDLASMNREKKPAVIVAARGFPSNCSDTDSLRADLESAVRDRFTKHGLAFQDLDTLFANRYGATDASSLRGFGSRVGRGHFNEQGNAILGEVLAELIMKWAKRDGV